MWYIIPTVVGKGLNLCILDMFDHICSGLKKSKFLCTNVPRICSLTLVFSACGLLYLQWLQKGLNLCILDMFDIPAVVWKSLNLYVQMFQEFVHYSCVVSCTCGLTYIRVVGKGLNLCIFDMFDHTCSGLKKSKFLCTNVPRTCSYSCIVFSHCGLPYLQWLEKV